MLLTYSGDTSFTMRCYQAKIKFLESLWNMEFEPNRYTQNSWENCNELLHTSFLRLVFIRGVLQGDLDDLNRKFVFVFFELNFIGHGRAQGINNGYSREKIHRIHRYLLLAPLLSPSSDCLWRCCVTTGHYGSKSTASIAAIWPKR
jgi:hypothetical protein